jgi:hypothetical protein
VIAPDDYCREIESYLCRKNEGHLIRIVGPAFEQVSRWAREGIPLKVACSGVDRYFERYYRKGPRRRPVRIEFCEADVRDAYDDWRRAVGVAQYSEQDAEADGGAPAPAHSPGRRSSLAAHLERALNRLTALRGSTQTAFAFGATLDDIVRRLDAMRSDAKRVRGDARAALARELEALDRQLLEAAITALADDERERLSNDADRELEPFRERMLPDAFAKAQVAAFERLVRAQCGLPALGYD